MATHAAAPRLSATTHLASVSVASSYAAAFGSVAAIDMRSCVAPARGSAPPHVPQSAMPGVARVHPPRDVRGRGGWATRGEVASGVGIHDRRESRLGAVTPQQTHATVRGMSFVRRNHTQARSRATALKMEMDQEDTFCSEPETQAEVTAERACACLRKRDGEMVVVL